MVPTASTTQDKTANLGVRVLAAIIDSLIVSFAWYYIIEIWGHTGPAGSLTSATMGGGKVLSGTPALLLMLATACYWIIPEWLFRATLGKFICGLRVSSVDGTAISLWQSLKRNILRLVDFFPFYLTGFLTAALTPKHQRLGDLWANTIVVSKRHSRQAPEQSLESNSKALTS